MSSPSIFLRADFATREGTTRYAHRFHRRAAAGHFRTVQSAGSLQASSIGIGTYLGDPDAAKDQAYTEAVVAAVKGGINLIDSAINYRLQRSERAIGGALKELEAAGYQRDELILCTKGGFLTPDADMPDDPSDYFYREYVQPGIFRLEDIAAESHCIAPKYLENQLLRSRHNLGVECVDIYYVHNPETQLGEVNRQEFLRRIRAAFEFLESAVGAGHIRFYGLATWNGFRQPENARDYLSLAEVAGIARQLRGDDHHFRFVQLPFNLAMTEALTRSNQLLNGRHMAMVDAARELGIVLVGSAALLQGHLGRNLPEYIARTVGLSNDFERALQFARSAPGITAALVGMSRVEHVAADLKLVGVPPLAMDQLMQLFGQRRQG